MSTVSIRYIVNDVDAAIAFYCGRLGFSEQMHPAAGCTSSRSINGTPLVDILPVILADERPWASSDRNLSG